MRRFFPKSDPMFTMACAAIIICLLKFLMEGVSVTLEGHVFDLGHADASTYAAILAPILGAHGYVAVKTPKGKVKVDNPDEV